MFEIDTQMDQSWNGNPRPLISMFFMLFFLGLYLARRFENMRKKNVALELKLNKNKTLGFSWIHERTHNIL